MARRSGETPRWLPWVVGVAASAGVAAAWIPIRTRVSNVNAALLLVAVVAAVGLLGRRGPVLLSAAVAAIAFDALDTAPYGTLAIDRAQDVVTTIVLALVGAGCGELALRLWRARRAATGPEGFRRVRQAAALVASGEETVLVLGSVGNEISRLLHLADCCFEAGIPPSPLPEVTRQSGIEPPLEAAGELALPVWASGRRIGYYRMVLAPGAVLDRESLTVAVTLADQAGAALAAFEPIDQVEPPEPGSPGGSGAPGDPDRAQPGAEPARPGHLRLLR